MKKTLLMIAAMMGLMAVSCTQEKLENPAAGQEVNVTLSAMIPEEISTKADGHKYSDGSLATKLVYAVYDSGSKTPLFYNENVAVNNFQAKIDITLISGKTYDILFWAQSPNNKTYTYSLEQQTMTVDYEKMLSNDDNNDAFYAFETFTVTGAINRTVNLYRPFAQVNLGTDDLAASQDESFKLGQTSMTAKVANVLNFVDGTVTGDAVFPFAANDVPNLKEDGTIDPDNKDGEFPVKGYNTYLAMNYLLVGAEQTTTNCEFKIYEQGKENETNTITVTNVPVRRNYRTNIYGSLLTDPANLKIVIEPSFEKEDVNMVDGQEAFETALASLEASTGKDATIVLESDITLNTLGTGTPNPLIKRALNLTIVGKGHTITAVGEGISNIEVGEGGVLTIKNAVIVDKSESYAEESWELGYLEFGGTVRFEDCSVNNAILMKSVKASFVNCRFNSNDDNQYAVWVNNGTASFEKCYFTGARAIKICDMYKPSDVTEVLVDGCTFENLTKKPGIAIDEWQGTEAKITIKNSEFINVQPGDQGEYIYETDNVHPALLENNKVVKSAMTIDDVDEAIKSGVYNITVVTAPEAAGTVVLPAVEGDEEVTVTLPATEHEITFAYENPSDGQNIAKVNINAPSSENLVINLPQSHVTLNGQDYGTVTATVSPTTLVVAEGTSVETLNLLAGNAEIYGTVGTVNLESGAAVKNYAVETAEDAARAVACKAENILVGTADGLVALAGLDNLAHKQTVKLTADIDMAGIEFAGLKAFNSGNPNTFDGQGFTVSNVTNTSLSADMGFIKSWVGTIKNVTIKDAEFKTRGRSAILAANVYGDIENCHIVGGSIGDRYWACGAIAGLYNSGNITGCTVDGVLISSNGGVGGIVGVINETGGERKITNCKVLNSDVISSGAYGSPYADGVIFGMGNVDNSTIIVTGCVVENSEPVNIYGWAEESTVVVVDGKAFMEASSKDALQAALDKEGFSELNITLTKDIEGDVTVSQKEGINIVVDGNGHKYEGKIIIDGMNGRGGKGAGATETLAIRNVNFVMYSESNVDIIGDARPGTSYPHNVTIQNCSFDGTTSTGAVVALRLNKWYNIKMLDCTVKNSLHSAVQGSGGGKGLHIENVTGTCNEGGFNLGTIPFITIKNVNVTAEIDYGYGIRVDANTAATPVLTVEGCELKADAPIILRKSTAGTTYTINLAGNNTLIPAKNNVYQIVATKGNWNASTPLATPEGTVNITGAEGMTIYR